MSKEFNRETPWDHCSSPWAFGKSARASRKPGKTSRRTRLNSPSTNTNGQSTTLSKLEALRILSLWYLDDGIGMGPKEEVLKALEIVTEQAQKVGLRLNLAKCEVWSEDEAALAGRCKPEGFELLGVGIGSQALCEKILDKRVSKIAESLAMMTVVDDPQTELSLMRCCLGYPRFAFAIRSTPPALIRTATRKFDELMEETAKERFDIGFDERKLKQWTLTNGYCPFAWGE